MKGNSIFVLVVTLAILGLPTQVQARPRPTPVPIPTGKVGRVIVQRAPNLGSDLFSRLSIDGKHVANIPRNQHYGGVVAAGRHTLMAIALPNTESRRPTSMLLIVKPGQVCIFTATWSSDRLVLASSNYYMPTTRVGDVRR